ncbi:MAG: hypothetical protein EPN62_19105 [Candidimonas sp.]|nr:MAG: hypothetical protein EPN77_07565 [Candidimonas sp.]TAM18938.1 MAG: hypothetical protein EPN62_19105 [Candidimonas sp.]
MAAIFNKQGAGYCINGTHKGRRYKNIPMPLQKHTHAADKNIPMPLTKTYSCRRQKHTHAAKTYPSLTPRKELIAEWFVLV